MQQGGCRFLYWDRTRWMVMMNTPNGPEKEDFRGGGGGGGGRERTVKQRQL